LLIFRVGQNHTFIGIYGVHTVFLAGKSPYIRSYAVQIYGSGQPYLYSATKQKHLFGRTSFWGVSHLSWEEEGRMFELFARRSFHNVGWDARTTSRIELHIEKRCKEYTLNWAKAIMNWRSSHCQKWSFTTCTVYGSLLHSRFLCQVNRLYQYEWYLHEHFEHRSSTLHGSDQPTRKEHMYSQPHCCLLAHRDHVARGSALQHQRWADLRLLTQALAPPVFRMFMSYNGTCLGLARVVYLYTDYTIFGHFLLNSLYIHRIYMVLALFTHALKVTRTDTG